MFAPAPDPAPHTGNAPVVVVGTTVYETPALGVTGPLKGRRIPGWWFRCTVPVHGARYCVAFHR